jgi:bis(5'-nucleosyl)-tetraphosphatase (symmetrical)
MVDESLVPWFTIDPKRFSQAKWIFGHWASLMGDTGNDNVIALDTGYVWGNALTIYHFESGEKIQIR